LKGGKIVTALDQPCGATDPGKVDRPPDMPRAPFFEGRPDPGIPDAVSIDLFDYPPEDVKRGGHAGNKTDRDVAGEDAIQSHSETVARDLRRKPDTGDLTQGMDPCVGP
jgi:hypothetical protein